MKLIIRPLIMGAAASLLLASCLKQGPSPDGYTAEIPQDSDVPIVFTADGFTAESHTRAVTETTSNTLNSFYASATLDTPSVNTLLWNNATFTKSGSKYYSDKYWPSTGTGMKFWASNETLVYASPADGFYVNAANTKDVVIAYETSPTFKGANKLTFRHIFARLGYCNISVTNGYTISDLSITMTPNTGGKYYISSGIWGSMTTGSLTTLASALNSTTSLNLYLIPGTYTLDATYTATKGDSYSKEFTLSTNITLQAGAINNITGSITGDATEINFTVDVASWTDNNITNVTFN